MHNFSSLKENAINEMREMNKKAVHTEPLFIKASKVDENKTLKNNQNNFLTVMSGDDMLIIGLILILSGDCRDIWLFLALAYILMG